MDIYEVIDKQLERLFIIFVDHGDIDSDEYAELLEPLHEILLTLGKENAKIKLPDGGLWSESDILLCNDKVQFPLRTVGTSEKQD